MIPHGPSRLSGGLRPNVPALQGKKCSNQDTGITLFLHNPVYLLTDSRGEHYEH